jgi:hypothetical protein
MIYVRDSIEYHTNYAAFQEMEEHVPMTRFERDSFRLWVKCGHDIDSNPWKVYETDGQSMNYLKALRIRCGASHGPWDSWEYAPFVCTADDGFHVIRRS